MEIQLSLSRACGLYTPEPLIPPRARVYNPLVHIAQNYYITDYNPVIGIDNALQPVIEDN